MKSLELNRRRAGRVILAAGAFSLLASSGADAEVIFEIPIDGVAYGAEGTELLVGSAPVPTAYVGQTCLVIADSRNQESVHPNNDLIIVNGDERIVIENVESEAGIVNKVDEFETISPTVEVYLRFGPDEVSSGGFSLSVDCSVKPPTTTTAPPPLGPDATPAPPTGEPETVTSAPAPAGPEAGAELPVTGSSSLLLVMAGVVIVAVGVLLRHRAATDQFQL